MSNILKAITFLKSSPENRFLVLYNSTGGILGLEKNYLKDIPNDDLAGFIKLHLGPTTSLTNVWIECREMRGVTHKKVGNGFTVEILPEGQKAQAPPIVETEEIPAQQAVPMRQEQNYGFLGAPGAGNNASMIGMTLPQLMEMQRKADRLDDVKEILEEKKQEIKKLRHEKDIQEIELRTATSKLAVATAEKDMAVLLAKTENKSFFDSPAFQNLMDKAPDMMGKIVALKTGIAPEANGALGAPNLSETKASFVDYISENLTDTEVNYLGSICHFKDNPSFMSELQTLITKYHAS